jgi:hypothetical protein
MRLCPCDAVGERLLLSAWQQLREFRLRQAKLFGERVDRILALSLALIGEVLHEGPHDGRKSGIAMTLPK